MAKQEKQNKKEDLQQEKDLEQTKTASKKDNKKHEKSDKKAEPKSEQTNDTDKKDEPINEVEELKKQLEESKNKYIRLSAEFDNYRKRTLKEKMEMIQNASGDVLSGILPIVDDFERALKVMEESEDFSSAKEGTVLIYNKLNEFMKSKNIVEIEAVNADFDTDLHEAITKIPAPTEDLKGKVVDVVQKGYKINDKVIRFAKVVIGE